jgi:hypothetical protein
MPLERSKSTSRFLLLTPAIGPIVRTSGRRIPPINRLFRHASYLGSIMAAWKANLTSCRLTAWQPNCDSPVSSLLSPTRTKLRLITPASSDLARSANDPKRFSVEVQPRPVTPNQNSFPFPLIHSQAPSIGFPRSTRIMKPMPFHRIQSGRAAQAGFVFLKIRNNAAAHKKYPVMRRPTVCNLTQYRPIAGLRCLAPAPDAL